MAQLISADGSQREVLPANGSIFKLEELQALVAGGEWIEILRLPGVIMVFDEEGKFKDLPENKRATTMARVAGIAHDDYMVGDVLLVQSSEMGSDEDEEADE